jgi:tetratricopeptide (TPR) repeat protein
MAMTASRVAPTDPPRSEVHARETGAVASGDFVQKADTAAGRDINQTTINLLQQGTPEALYQLPRDISDFTGRDVEMELLTSAVARDDSGAASAVVITALAGKPGVGKSALAIHAAHAVKDRFPDGQLYVDLRGPTGPVDPARVLDGFLRQLGVAGDDVPATLDDRVVLYRSRLSQLRLLILLDNAASEEQVRPLLPGSPTCGVLITSRARLDAVEGAIVRELEVLDEASGLDLLRKLVGADRVDAEPEATRSIVRLCGRLPLAVRIAGGRLAKRPSWSLERFAERLSHAQTRLDELKLGDREVRASFKLSYDALSPDDQMLFRSLGAVGGDDFIPQIAAAAIDAPIETTTRMLEGLVDSQLLETPEADRYRYHDLLRLFAQELLAEESREDQAATHERIGRAYLWLAHLSSLLWTGVIDQYLSDAADPVQTKQGIAALVDRERENLSAAIRAAHEHELWDITHQLATSLTSYWQTRADWSAGVTTLRIAADAAQRSGNEKAIAAVLTNLGAMLSHLREWDEAEAVLEEARRRCRKRGLEPVERDAVGNLALLYWRTKRYDQALSYLELELKLCQKAGATRKEGLTLTNMGLLHWSCERFEEAEMSFRAAIAHHEAEGNRFHQGRALGNLGLLLLSRKRIDEAVEAVEMQVEISHEFGDSRGIATGLSALSHAYVQREDWASAASVSDEAAHRWLELGHPRSAAETLLRAVLAYAELGQTDEADMRFETAQRLAPELVASLSSDPP